MIDRKNKKSYLFCMTTINPELSMSLFDCYHSIFSEVNRKMHFQFANELEHITFFCRTVPKHSEIFPVLQTKKANESIITSGTVISAPDSPRRREFGRRKPASGYVCIYTDQERLLPSKPLLNSFSHSLILPKTTHWKQLYNNFRASYWHNSF